ncbi:MAG: hypothetical protein ABT01_02350 [Clostridium sp. SCN 57-10]|mgnify:CR=1 FL=1|nr:MAG: hypothetical protein ABT01_02350 [Clostridium sp. SCN 57-10]
MKIAVIGYSGAGKSTLAAALGARYGCVVQHLDKIHWTAGWKERDPAEEQVLMTEAMRNDTWVMDGNYPHLAFERRMEEADLIVFFAFPRFICFLQAFSRYRHYRGKTRNSMTEGCEEQFDWEFIRWILWDGRTRERRKLYHTVKQKHGDKMVVLKSRSDVRMFQKSLG